jgi:hypothetical protein
MMLELGVTPHMRGYLSAKALPKTRPTIRPKGTEEHSDVGWYAYLSIYT